jgi:hypothetical protein
MADDATAPIDVGASAYRALDEVLEHADRPGAPC